MKKMDYLVREVTPGTWAINEFDMDFIYLVEGRDRSLLIDTGTGTGDLRSLAEKLTKKPYDVVCTHGHVDHCGGIAQFPKIFMHPADIPDILLGNGRDGTISVFNRRRYAKLGLALHRPEALPFTLDSFLPVDTSKIEFRPIHEGCVFDLGDRTVRVLETPGHSLGCISLLDEMSGNLFAGDAVGRIQILNLPLSEKEMFAVWLQSAKRIRALADKGIRILSGHFCPFPQQLLEKQIACAEQVLCGQRQEEYVEVDEYAGFMYRLGDVFFTLRKENLLTRDYQRIAARRKTASEILGGINNGHQPV